MRAQGAPVTFVRRAAALGQYGVAARQTVPEYCFWYAPVTSSDKPARLQKTVRFVYDFTPS